MIRLVPVGGGIVVLITPVPPTCAACGEYAPDHAVTCDERPLRPVVAPVMRGRLREAGALAPPAVRMLSDAERIAKIADAAARQRPRQDTP